MAERLEQPVYAPAGVGQILYCSLEVGLGLRVRGRGLAKVEGVMLGAVNQGWDNTGDPGPYPGPDLHRSQIRQCPQTEARGDP